MKGKSKGLVQSRLDFNTGRTGPATEEVRNAVSLETPKDAGSSEAARSMLIPLTSAISLISPIQGYDKANQPDIMFPKTKKYNASRAFQFSWFRLHPWLHYAPGDKVFCFICCQARDLGVGFSVHTQENFITIGYQDWTNATKSFKTHEGSQQHLDSVMFFANKSKEIPAMMTPEYLRQQQEARISLELMLSSLLYLAKQGDPIRGHDNHEGHYRELLRLRAQDRPELKAFLARGLYLSPQITNELLNGLMRATLLKVADEIKLSP